jgi:hypothetical protein
VEKTSSGSKTNELISPLISSSRDVAPKFRLQRFKGKDAKKKKG